METSKETNISIPILLVLYDFRYLWKDNREISVKKGEKLLLLEKTNKDWWQVVRPTEKKSFFVPAQYVEVIVKEKTDGRHAGASSRDDSDPSVLYENLDSLKQQADLPSLSSVRKSDINAPKLSRDKKDMIVLSQDGVKQKPIPKTRTKVTGKSTDGTTDLTRSNASDPKYSFSQSSESDNNDKSDKSKINNKTSQDFILSIPKESNPSCAFHEDKNYRGKSAPRAVENLVYCNVPLGGNKSCIAKQDVKPSDVQNRLNIEAGKNRMKNSYNLKTKPTKNTEVPKQGVSIKNEVKSQQPPSLKKDKLSFNQNFSKSLEKLAEEIQFEPKKVSAGAGVSTDNISKGKCAKMPKDISEKKSEKKGKTNDASIVLDETKAQPQSRSVFSRFRRSLHHSSSFKSNNIKRMSKSSKKACELSLSWEGGLDKIQEKKENEEKQQVTPLGLQRSRTFMIVERSPLSLRPTNKIFSGKHRLDTAYHSQRKPEEKVTLSTFKPIFNLDMTTHTPIDLVNKTVEKEPISKYPLERKKLQTNLLGQVKDKNSDEITADKKEESELKPVLSAEENKSAKVLPGKRSGYENVSKKYQKVVAPECDLSNQTTGHKNLTLYTEPYSNSESDDNLEEKSLALIANKSLRSQSSVESNTTVSEETEPSESDENNSLEFVVERRGNQSAEQPANKRRTSLVRSSRVESTKVRKVTARPPPTPPPDQKPLKDLGEGWGAYISKGGRSYYYNEKTGEKNWKPPRRKVAVQEKGLDGSHESVCSDFNRSDTSSPSNENFQIFNSNGSLHSKSVDNSSFEMSKSSSVSRWKEDSPDDLNRSSYNSSPITGLSQSSTYSLNKSSRDSLNRFSPIENVPSEEEGLELYDHVYQDDISKNKKIEQGRVEEEERRRSKGSESIDTSTFRIKPGWEEFYDENLDQIFYMFKNRKEKWILSFDPEERAYFFEETSKKSLWALPDYSSEESKAEFNYSIQRSATESAINNESSAKLRLNKDGGKGGRTSASTRSSKAQSMLIDPKFDLSSKDGNKTYSMPRDLSKIYGEIIRFGVLNKTKISENGKKLRKNWTPAFVVLTESCLFFFKDAKSFQNIKNVISSNGNHMCLTLQGAVIEKGDKISSRKNVYKISCPENTDVLIQSDKTAEAEEWFKEISTVIQNLPQESKATGNSPLLDLNSPSKVGRTKSLKVRSKDTGSMEDLSSTPEERQNKIKARLKKFFIRRPTVDSLKKKGIWKDEPVFGCSLEQITKNRNPRVPIFVEKCIEFIESKEENMKTDGLYRASGNLSQVQKIRLEVDQNNLSIMKDEEDVHVLTGSLKLFFRELKEPLIPSKQLEPALLATDKQVRKERIKDFQKIVKSLPTPNYDTLKFLLQHLLRVKEYHKYNRMNINNLAIVFGPTLMWPEQESANMALELMQQNVVIECLLKEFHEIFT